MIIKKGKLIVVAGKDRLMSVKVREKPKGSGQWWIFIDHQGRRKAKKVGSNKKMAMDLAKKLEARLVLEAVGLPENPALKKPNFGEYAEIWISTTIPVTSKPSTLTDYQSILRNHVLPKFGKTPVTDINRMAIKTFLLEKLKTGLAHSTVSHMKSVISGVLNLAVDDGVISANPAHRLGKIFPKKQIDEGIDPLTREELALLLEAFREHYPMHYPLALTLARTGMRLKEAWSLQWGDIDFHGRFINVRRTFSRGHIVSPKSGKSRRVDMSNQLAKALADLKKARKVQALKNGWSQAPEWVFVNDQGKIPNSDTWRKRIFKRCIEKAGLRAIRIHDLRHTYASLLIQAGESLAYVRDQLGHHSIQVTVDIYGHLAPGGNKEAVDRLDDDVPDATIRNLYATRKERGVNHVG